MPKAFNPKSVALLRKRGYIAENTEHWNNFAKISQDLFGFVDVAAVRDGILLLVQVTSKGGMSTRLKKIQTNSIAKVLMTVPGVRISIHGWHAEKHGKVNRWKVVEKDIQQVDFWGGVQDG